MHCSGQTCSNVARVDILLDDDDVCNDDDDDALIESASFPTFQQTQQLEEFTEDEDLQPGPSKRKKTWKKSIVRVSSAEKNIFLSVYFVLFILYCKKIIEKPGIPFDECVCIFFNHKSFLRQSFIHFNVCFVLFFAQMYCTTFFLLHKPIICLINYFCVILNLLLYVLIFYPINFLNNFPFDSTCRHNRASSSLDAERGFTDFAARWRS